MQSDIIYIGRCAVAKSSNGTLHMGMGPTATRCHSSGRGLSNYPASAKKIAAASDETFCEKCFSAELRQKAREAAKAELD